MKDWRSFGEDDEARPRVGPSGPNPYPSKGGGGAEERGTAAMGGEVGKFSTEMLMPRLEGGQCHLETSCDC